MRPMIVVRNTNSGGYDSYTSRILKKETALLYICWDVGMRRTDPAKTPRYTLRMNPNHLASPEAIKTPGQCSMPSSR
jgi:hypothetical protein